jgi:hypothetical protein
MFYTSWSTNRNEIFSVAASVSNARISYFLSLQKSDATESIAKLFGYGTGA